MSVKLRNTAKNIYIDDTSSDRVTGQVNSKLSDFVASLDRAQDKDDRTHFRPENVLGEITSFDVNTPAGWYLSIANDGELNNLVYIDTGTISDRTFPRKGDRIVIDGIEKQFDGTSWVEPARGSDYFVDPVIGIVDAVANLRPSATEGDRYLVKSPISIQQFKDNAWVESELKGNAIAAVVGKQYFYQNFNGAVSRFPSVDFAGLPLIIRGKFNNNIALSNLEFENFNFAGSDYYLYHVAFDNLDGSIFTRGAWNEGIYSPTINESFNPHISLNFAKHNTQINPVSYCVWLESSDLVTWNAIALVWEQRGEGYFNGQPLIDLTAGKYYRLALLLSEPATTEDIIQKDFSAINFGRNDTGAKGAIADAELLLAPIVGNQIRTNQNGDLVDITYPVTVQAISVQPQSLNLELMEIGNSAPINAQTYNNPVLGETINFVSAQVDAIDGIEPRQFYLRWSIN